MSIVAIVQSRMGSTRFPGKVMHPICQSPMIDILLQRLSKSRLIDQIVVATTTDTSDNVLADHVAALGYGVYRGSKNDVLDRYHSAAQQAGASMVIWITGDCPLVDANLVDSVIAAQLEQGVDYASNILPPSYPDGLDIEVFTINALNRAWSEASDSFDREHVTPYLRRIQVLPVSTSVMMSIFPPNGGLSMSPRISRLLRPCLNISIQTGHSPGPMWRRSDKRIPNGLRQIRNSSGMQVRKWVLVRSCGSAPSALSRGATCCCPSARKCSSRRSGPPISAARRA